MWNLATAHRTDLVGGDGDNGSRLAGEGHKLDLIRFVLGCFNVLAVFEFNFGENVLFFSFVELLPIIFKLIFW